MLLKIVGSILVIGASSLIGYAYSRDSSRRPQELRTLQGLLQIFETEICYLSNVLSEAFEKISGSSGSEVTGFFRDTVLNLKSSDSATACQAWEQAVDRNAKKTALKAEDIGILMAFGKMLGNSDLEGQIKNIRLTVEKLKLQEQKAEESRKKNESMFKSLGVLGGLALVIMLF